MFRRVYLGVGNKMQFSFKTKNDIYGLIVELIDNNPYDKITVDIWIGKSYTGSYEIPHSFDINDDHFGKSTAIFTTRFKPFKTSEMIKIKIKTKLLHNDQIIMNLCENN